MSEEEARLIANALVDVVLERFGLPMSGRQKAPAASNDEPKFMKVTDFAKSRGFSRATIHEYVKRGMPSIQVGHRGRRVDVAAASEWLRMGGAG